MSDDKVEEVIQKVGSVHFEAPVIQNNSKGWGPCELPNQFKDIPYQPFSKSDRLGKVRIIMLHNYDYLQFQALKKKKIVMFCKIYLKRTMINLIKRKILYLLFFIHRYLIGLELLSKIKSS